MGTDLFLQRGLDSNSTDLPVGSKSRIENVAPSPLSAVPRAGRCPLYASCFRAELGCNSETRLRNQRTFLNAGSERRINWFVIALARNIASEEVTTDAGFLLPCI